MAGGLGKAKGKLDNVLSRSQVIEHYQGREEKRPSDSIVSRKRGGLFVGGGDGRCVGGGVPLTSRDRKLARPNAARFVRVS